jgi:long-chain acyl-CoA synthetase
VEQQLIAGGSVSPSLDAATVCEAFQRIVAAHPDRPALRKRGERGMTWAELGARVRDVATGLAALGLGKGDTLALLLPNVPECHLVDYAAIHLGAVPFTIYNTSAPQQIIELLETAQPSVLVTDSTFLETVETVTRADPRLRHVIVTDLDAPSGCATMTLAELERSSRPDFDFERAWRSVNADDLLTLIFTSGTTGPPKGVHWSHRTTMTQLRALDATLPLPSEAVISFMPLAHAGGRITAHYFAMPYGATITCCPVVMDYLAYLPEVRPDVLFLPPRMWEKLQVAIEAQIAELHEGDRLAVRARIARGVEQAFTRQPPAPTPEVLRPIFERVGTGRVKIGVVGGAPAAAELSAWFRAVGLPMLEAYGGTETGLCVFNTIDDFKGGTAGKPLPGVELKLLDDGEICVRSDLQMVGYRNDPVGDAEAIDADGWLHSGDIGELDADGFLRVIDRKREIIISAAAKNMSPANIEQAIKAESSLIAQIVCIGDRRRFNTALITLDPHGAATAARGLGLQTTDVADLATAPEILKEIQVAVDCGNAKLSRVETIRKFTLLPDIWMPDSDLLTPIGKVKRRGVNARYADAIERMYAESPVPANHTTGRN